ncbi:DUF4091 domain-containing protein [Parablautia intestinalis]|uniref:DUF4091 domain-containing protein n=1 Tax=Parablautia intestinalis TaxID=2320100 RepID=UPI00259C73F3|nr:DUF4091 domain-containing protein [Parablautia intestinalis]
MNVFEFYLTDSLEKVFPDKKPAIIGENSVFSILRGEKFALQLVYGKVKADPQRQELFYKIKGSPVKARVRDVELIPSAFPCYETNDKNYLTTMPGLFPDLLKPRKDNKIVPLMGQYRSLWIDFPDTEKVEAGIYPVEILIFAGDLTLAGADTLQRSAFQQAGDAAPEEKVIERLSFYLEIADTLLPEQTLIHTEWFHCDCLANYYHTEVFDEQHWKVIEDQLMLAGKELGINMILTPVFTPPIDTAVGGERRTVQLVDISFKGGQYFFQFEKLIRWCEICKKCGILYLEIPHLFTQWGAASTPKIEVRVNGVMEKRFGWHVPAQSAEYKEFLAQFLPALCGELEKRGFDREHVYFHISDEPAAENRESYGQAKSMTADLLSGRNVIDALSDFLFYEKGLVDIPVVSNDHIDRFIRHGVKDLWVYYCCAQCRIVPNRFFAMPGARNRIMGVLMYLYRIKGFLHWGYNFYNSQFSKEAVDPFFNTHAGYAFPSGDPFLVYPGKNGEAWSSIRGEVQREGLSDLQALYALEKTAGRERVEEIIYEGEDGPFTFTHYPTGKEYFFRLRRRIAEELKACQG